MYEILEKLSKSELFADWTMATEQHPLNVVTNISSMDKEDKD